jgi:drug/metabolite transporter (DMT)-like permease
MPKPIHEALTWQTAALLTIAPVLWAGNAIVGQMLSGMVPPIALNALRWWGAFLLLLPFTAHLFKPTSPLWKHWRRLLLLGFLSMSCYNALLYKALQTSNPINVTLVGSSMPMFMLTMGWLLYGVRVAPAQWVGVGLSFAGVLTVLIRGEWSQIAQLQWAIGDVYMLLATAAWSWYSWLLIRPPSHQPDPVAIRRHWATWLMAQLAPSLITTSLMTGLEWQQLPSWHIAWGWPLIGGLVFVSVGPAIMAYGAWGVGVSKVGPQIAVFFANLTPLFTALLSTLWLHQWPAPYHFVAFILIVAGIVISNTKRPH